MQPQRLPSAPLTLDQWCALRHLWQAWERVRVVDALKPKVVHYMVSAKGLKAEALRGLQAAGLIQRLGPDDRYAQITEAGKVYYYINVGYQAEQHTAAPAVTSRKNPFEVR